MPDEEQVDQLLAMYDSDFDQLVSPDELSAFLSRGLSRREPVQVIDVGEEPGTLVGNSPWGRLDADADFTLDAQELMAASKALSTLDFNGDGIIAKPEAQQPTAMGNNATAMNQNSMFETRTLQVADTAIGSADGEQQRAARRKMSLSILDHYTFLDAIPKDQWSAWHATRWQLVDTDGDQLLNREELKGLADLEPDLRLVLRFPPMVPQDEMLRGKSEPQILYAVSTDESLRLKADRENEQAAASSQKAVTHRRWISHGNSGRVRTPGLIADVEVQDLFSRRGQELLRQRLSAALQDSQLRSFLVNQLELDDDAFDLLDLDEDQMLDDKEFQRAWRWLSVRQGSRTSVRWMKAAMPWFRVLDEDGDGRLIAREVGASGADAHCFGRGQKRGIDAD